MRRLEGKNRGERKERKRKKKRKKDGPISISKQKFPPRSQVSPFPRCSSRVNYAKLVPEWSVESRGGKRGGVGVFRPPQPRDGQNSNSKGFLAATPSQQLVNRLASLGSRVWAEWVREKKICLPTRYSHGCPKCAAICRSPGRPPDTVYLSPIRCTSANKREEGGKKKVGERDSNRVETL